ncbi:MAG: hypothetical protein JRI68_29510 [Deltaproteobacteria bacterium]|nr:hypothetical protein [Deltaproteobacteria bacterium]
MSDSERLLLHFFAGWVNRRQLNVIEYLKEESILLREQLGGRRLRLTDSCTTRGSSSSTAIPSTPPHCATVRSSHHLGRDRRPGPPTEPAFNHFWRQQIVARHHRQGELLDELLTQFLRILVAV